MKQLKIFQLGVFIIVLISCTVNEAPEFIGIKNIKVVESSKTFITIKGEGLFKNPNEGTVVHASNYGIWWNLGEHSKVWDEELFEVYNGEVVLSN